MSDDQMMNDQEPGAPQGEPTVLPAPPKPKGESGRNVLLVVAAVIVLLAIVGVVGYVFYASQTAAPVATNPVAPAPVTSVTPGTSGSTTTSGSAAGTSALPPVPDETNSDVFSPRDPFKVIAPTVIVPPGTESSESETGGVESATTLTLKDIKTVDGVKKAVVSLGGTSYTVGVGDTVDDSAWKVVTINSSSVVFLYGDDRVTISLGQGTSK